MILPRVELGEVLPLVRRMQAVPDPQRLFAALTNEGRREDTVLLESADALTGAGRQSMLLSRTCLRIRALDTRVEVHALTSAGHALLPWVDEVLRPVGTIETMESGLRLILPEVAREGRSEHERLEASGSLEVLRRLAWTLRCVSRPAPVTHLLAGVFSYDLVSRFEPVPSRPLEGAVPDYVFWMAEEWIHVDHHRGQTTVLSLVPGGARMGERYHDALRSMERLCSAVMQAPVAPVTTPVRPPPVALGPVASDLSDDAFAERVVQLKENVRAGDVFQVVASRTFSVPCAHPFAAYSALRSGNPSPYMFYVSGPDGVLLGASPETSVKVTGQPRRVEIKPIAGTAPRGRDASGQIDEDLDTRLEAELRTHAKELAEHMMLVDLARNDVARVALAGTRRVETLLSVERYAHVMHLVSRVIGELDPRWDALHAYQACLNMGTLTGAPKVRAAQLLREVEATARGAYGGAVGYLTQDGEMDSAIVIRSAWVRDGRAYVRAGAGIVMDSDPMGEANETRRKAEAVLQAIARAADKERGA